MRRQRGAAHCFNRLQKPIESGDDMSDEQFDKSELLSLTSDIVASHVSNNPVSMADLPQLIEQVYTSLKNLAGPEVEPKEELKPAVPIKKSVTDDYIICLEDGKKMKMLKRHLSTAYGMTPEQYREKWGLSADYPMVAPSYSLKRQRLAKENGLGRNRGSE
jgi:predicted transcriptional regulator